MRTLLMVVLVAGPVLAQPAPKAKGVTPAVRSLSFSPDGARLAAAVGLPGGGGRVLVWDVAGRKLVATSDKLGDAPLAAYSPDGRTLAVADGKTSVTLLDPTTGKVTGQLGPFESEVTGLFAGTKGQWLTLGKDKAIRQWSEADKKVTRQFRGFQEVWAWTVSPGGTWLLVGTPDGERLWDLRTGDPVEGAIPGRRGIVYYGVFMTEDRFLAGNNNGTHKVFEIPSGKELLRFKNEGGPDIVAYSSAAGMMANRYSTDTKANLTPLTLRAPTAAEAERVAALLKECDSDDYATREKAAAALAAVGPGAVPLLKKAAEDGPSAEVRMRARVAGEEILNKPKFRLTGHADEVRPIVFAPDGKTVATGAADGLVILWETATGKELVRLKAE